MNSESQYFKNIHYVDKEYLHNLNNVIDIFYEIFKENLCFKLLRCQVNEEEIVESNNFFRDTEYFITNIEEWKLDCAMKEIILLSKTERSNNVINSEKIKKEILEYRSNNKNKCDKKHFHMGALSNNLNEDLIPRFFSEEFYRFLLCINIYDHCESKRLDKANKIIERAVLKMFSVNKDGNDISWYFILFSDISTFIRIFPGIKITGTLIDIREHVFCKISRMSTELTKSLNESLLLLKVYFKEKHYDYMNLVRNFVPKRISISFEINFFNLLYSNILDSILCIKFVDNEKIDDLCKLFNYILNLSFHVPKGCIENYNRVKFYEVIFSSGLDEIISLYENGSIEVGNDEMIKLVSILFKRSKIRDDFIDSLQNQL